jgi:hypothetical protein
MSPVLLSLSKLLPADPHGFKLNCGAHVHEMKNALAEDIYSMSLAA